MYYHIFFSCEKNCEINIDVASPVMESELSRVVLKSKEDKIEEYVRTCCLFFIIYNNNYVESF